MGFSRANTAAEKRTVLVGIVLAWILGASFVGAGLALQGRFGPVFVTADGATVFAISVAALALAAGIGWAARTRHLVGHIDGARPKAGSGLDLAQRLLPVTGVWFALARAMFAVGYRIRPILRATGFVATFHATLALYLWILLTLAG